MEYVKYRHGKWVRKDLDMYNPLNHIRLAGEYIKHKCDERIHKDLDMYNATSVTLIINGKPLYEFVPQDIRINRDTIK